MLQNQPADLPVILLVTNRADIRQVVHSALESAPCHLVDAADAPAARESCDETQPALIILDSSLNLSLCAQLKTAAGADVSVLAVVESLHPSVIDRALESGADDTIVSPIHPRTLQHRVRHLLINWQHQSRQRALEAALHDAESRYRILFDSAPVAIFSKDRDGRYTTTNAENLTYHQPVNPLGLTDADIFPPEVATALRQADLQVMETGEELLVEEVVPTVRGTRIVLSRKVPLRDAHNEITGILGICVDITERKHAEASLQDSSELFRALFDHSPDAVLLLDAATNIIVDCNEAACRMNGYAPGELVGMHIGAINAPDYPSINPADYGYDDYVDLLRARRSLHYVTYHRRKDGEVFPVEVSTCLLTVAGRELILGIDRDITERLQAEAALRASEERYRLLAHYSTDLISRHALDSVFLYASPACETLLGYTPDELVGHRGYDLCHPDDRPVIIAHHRSIEGTQIAFSDVYRIMRKDGTYVWFETTSRKIQNPETGKIEELICVSRDITERKLMEAAERDQHLLLEALRDASAVLKNTIKTDEALDRILEQAVRVVPHDAASISLIEGDAARVVRCRGFKERGLEEFVLSLRFPINHKNRFYQKLLHEKIPVITDDVRDDPEWINNIWIRGNLTVPIILRDTVIGLLHVDSAEPGVFTQDHARRMQSFADQVAIAIHSAQLYDEVQALYHATSFLFASFNADNVYDLGKQITQAVVKEFSNTHCSLGIVDNAARRIVGVARTREIASDHVPALDLDGPGLIALAVREGQVVYVPDVSKDERYLPADDRTRSELVIPLRTRREVIGVLDLQSPELDAFKAHDQRVLLAFADRASAAIENLQYAQNLERLVAQRTDELRQTKEQVEAILNSSSDAIIVTEADGSIRRVNTAFNTMFGYEDDPGRSLSLFSLAAPDDQRLLEATLYQAAASRLPNRVEVALRRQDESLFDADVAIAPIQESDSQVRGLICSIRDITDRKRVELELRKALEQERELSELKSRFVSTASHEFRTPLAMIMTSSELLQRYGDRMTDQQKDERLSRIQIEVKNIARLLDDVLTVNKSAEATASEFSPLPMDIVDFCRQMIETSRLTDPGEHQFVLSCTGDYTRVCLDQHFMRAIMLNLLSNALKYSPPKSEIGIKLKCEQYQTVISVQDQGIGIPEEDHKRLFEAFHRGKNIGLVSGTGLGLTIARQAAELHGGTITFESVVGVGTTFTVTIPNLLVEEKHYDH